MRTNPIQITIAAAPFHLRPALKTLARDLSDAIGKFGLACDRAKTSPELQLAHCTTLAMTALAIVEQDMRAEHPHLRSFMAEAFAQRAMAAALDVNGDAAALQPMRRAQ